MIALTVIVVCGAAVFVVAAVHGGVTADERARVAFRRWQTRRLMRRMK
jgi:hypothetical protein